MSKIETGGPAFPRDPTTYTDAKEMALRDYFAAKAMPVVLDGFATLRDKNKAKKIAEMSYVMADAMLEARK